MILQCDKLSQLTILHYSFYINRKDIKLSTKGITRLLSTAEDTAVENDDRSIVS